MIATERFVFLHLHKSGGTFVNELLAKHVPGARMIGYHLPRMLAPAQYARLPALGFVRSPWSWYVSWYAFQRRRPQPNPLFRAMSEDGRLDFEATVRNLLALGTDDAVLDRALEALPEAYTGRGLNLPRFALAPVRGTGLGFYSYLERHLHGEPGPDLHVGRMERLREELPAMLERVGERCGGEFAFDVARAPARNVSEHGPYVDAYGEELRARVAARDAGVVERFGYAFGD